ncbi:MAG: hypothetical protein IPM79_22965 [Polyangiaceae bacterium]|nr:hypothetical protein [Polyangiaceae bacterium]MBK8940395.1 hypothetical protein [Polyangiaceae bacterium]
MRRSIVAASVFTLALAGFAGTASADDGEYEDEEEEVVVKKKKRKSSEEGEVRVIVVNESEPKRRKPRKIPAVEGEAPPEGYHTETQSMRGLWIAGISVFAAGYAVQILSGGIADAVHGHYEGKYTYYSLIPVAGPFIVAGHEEISAPGKVPFILWGIMQAGGMGMFIGGLAARKEVWVSNGASNELPAPEVYVGLGSIGVRQQF